MSRSLRKLLRPAVIATIGTTAVLALCVAAPAFWVTAIADSDNDAMWLAISLTVLGLVACLADAVIILIARVETCHNETRTQIERWRQETQQQIEDVATRLGRSIPDTVQLQLMHMLGETTREMVGAAEQLHRAQRTWRSKVGADTPVDMQQWRGRTADGATR